MTPRTLRAANCGFYIGCVSLIIFAVTYVLCTRELSLWLELAAVLAGIVGSLWGIYYIVLRYEVSPVGITRRSLFGTQGLLWRELSGIDYDKTESGGVASVRLSLQTPASVMVLSSELLDLEALETIATELKDAGVAINSHS